MLDLIPDSPAPLSKVAEYAANSKSQNTHKAYNSAWREFTAYCQNSGLIALPASPDTIASYLVALAEKGNSMRTLGVKLAAISHAHYRANQPDSSKLAIVRETLKGIRREHGKPVVKKDPITDDELRQMIAALPGDDITTIRNRAILLVGFAGAFRRSELVGLDVEDVRFAKGGMTITVQRSKTDQGGEGTLKMFPTIPDNALCAVTALRQWLKISGIKSGKLFRPVDQWKHVRNRGLTDKVVALIIKKTAEKAGLDSKRFSGHSLRIGFITTCANANVPEWAIMEQSGHMSTAVLRGYIKNTGKGARAAVIAALGE